MPMCTVEEGKSDFIVPPNVYWLDLTWIKVCDGMKGQYLRWFFTIADIEEQKKFVKCNSVTMTTPCGPTLKNRFGEVLTCLFGSVAVGMSVSTEDLVLSKYRVQAFVEQQSDKKDPDKIYCITKSVLTNTARKNVGIGPYGVPFFLVDEVNLYLKSINMPLIENESDSFDYGNSTSYNTNSVEQSVEQDDIPMKYPVSEKYPVPEKDFNW